MSLKTRVHSDIFLTITSLLMIIFVKKTCNLIFMKITVDVLQLLQIVPTKPS